MLTRVCVQYSTWASEYSKPMHVLQVADASEAYETMYEHPTEKRQHQLIISR